MTLQKKKAHTISIAQSFHLLMTKLFVLFQVRDAFFARQSLIRFSLEPRGELFSKIFMHDRQKVRKGATERGKRAADIVS